MRLLPSVTRDQFQVHQDADDPRQEKARQARMDLVGIGDRGEPWPDDPVKADKGPPGPVPHKMRVAKGPQRHHIGMLRIAIGSGCHKARSSGYV